MASDTQTQIYIHIVFSVNGKRSLIRPSSENDLYNYISAIIHSKGQLPVAVNGMPDHVHILLGMKPTCRISDLVREIKKSTHYFLVKNRLVSKHFSWQIGYGAFSCSHAELENMITYLENQKMHHKNKSFKDEFEQFFGQYNIGYENQYLSDWLEEE